MLSGPTGEAYSASRPRWVWRPLIGGDGKRGYKKGREGKKMNGILKGKEREIGWAMGLPSQKYCFPHASFAGHVPAVGNHFSKAV